jgi:hypothetical protein
MDITGVCQNPGEVSRSPGRSFGSGNSWHRDTGDFVTTLRALLDAEATIPPHAEGLEPSDAVLERLP